MGETYVRWLQAGLGGAPSDAAMARYFRSHGDRILSLPSCLRSGSFEASVLETELIDDVAYERINNLSTSCPYIGTPKV